MIVGAVLAGGHSLRMGGGHKFLRELHGVALLDRVLARLDRQVERIVVSSAPGRPFDARGLTIVEDVIREAGPLGGIHAVLAWAATTFGPATQVVTVPADMPFIPENLAPRLLAARSENSAELAIATTQSGDHPVIAVWPACLQGALEVWLTSPRSRAVRAFLETRVVARARFDEAADPFFNVNTPADLIAAEKWMEARHDR